jgi:hypothetical protein
MGGKKTYFCCADRRGKMKKEKQPSPFSFHHFRVVLLLEMCAERTSMYLKEGRTGKDFQIISKH